jgi:transcriptional regulator with XRE-family HTH domain
MSLLFGDKMRYLRRQHNITQSNLARQLAVSRAYINNIEADRKSPSLRMVLGMANLFGVATDYLLRDTVPVEDIAQYPANELSTSHPPCDLFGAKLRHLRLSHHVTQSDLANQLALAAHAHVSFLEAGRKEPSIDLVLRIADLFGVTTDYLLRDTITIETGPAEQS